MKKMINQFKMDLKKLQNDEGVKKDIPKCSISIDDNCCHHWCGDK